MRWSVTLVLTLCVVAASSARAGDEVDVERLQARIYQLENTLDSSRDRADTLAARNDELRNTVETLKRQLKQKQTRISRLEDQRKSARSSNVAWKQKWRARLADLEATRADYRAEQLAEKLDNAQAVTDRLQDRVSKQIGDFFSEFGAAMSRIDGIQEASAGQSVAGMQDLAPDDVRAACDGLADTLDQLESAPLGRPTPAGDYSSYYGDRTHPVTGAPDFHTGIDIGTDMGEPVRATAPGRVDRVVIDDGYGRMVEIAHPGGYTTLYAHLDSFSVDEGEQVHRGDKIGEIGNSGISTGPHIHYEIQLADGSTVDPKPYIDGFSPVAERFREFRRASAETNRDLRRGGPSK